MAFVSIDNPAGILHHGGQMAWDAVSDERVVMITFTKNYKALIQEINFVAGAPVVGVPSFIADISSTPGIAERFHLRPKVKAIAGTNYVFAMIPSAFLPASSSTIKLTGSTAALAYMGAGAGRMYMPSVYTGYILERAGDGTYSVKSSATINMPVGAISSGSFGVGVSVFIEEATATSIKIKIPGYINSYDNQYHQVTTATINNGVLSAFTNAIQGFGTGQRQIIWMVYDAKRVRDIKGRYKDLQVTGSALQALETTANRTVVTGMYDPTGYKFTYICRRDAASTNVGVGDNYHYGASIANTVLIDGDINEKAYYSVGHNAAGQNALLASTAFSYLAGVTPVYSPLDTGFVHSSGTVCVVGGQTDPTYASYFDIDLAYAIDFAASGGSPGAAIPLRLSFRQITGLGHYAGPFDPIQTGYHYNPYHNNNQILHKVSDSQFWLIGCFMDSPTADPKLGVISVSPPA
ncbi:hypothetical protein LU11_gp250 [Pseudomonas phage Lu11]|uniref:hypothetical protein n=1 Tax=Pseudomonas phage Lu11 TaxID=1161927 RepID=UPI00025F1821|nr:hypothetical protein LU11_gp250 [Pseudomonas phage Lu11]AFH14781.1 hypothetical protein Lu11_0245 [Pseudomonas phage Lu11]